MMTLRGHTVIHYGHEDSDVECTEHVNVLSREDYNRIYGDHDFRSKLFKFDQNDDAYKTFNSNAIREINKRKQPGDILLAFWGAGHQAICDGAGSDMKVVEPGIGYPWGHFAEYKIFESYAMYHAFLERGRVAQCSDMNLWSKEAVIPNYFSISDFVDEVVPAKDRGDYFLFVGRIGTAKGVQYAIQMTERLGIRLIIAGQNAEEGLREVGMFPPPKHVEVTGHIDAEKRKTLMANARAVVCMSTFAEPFCGVHVEALMSGTPVITADWGAFTEINMHGVTGFRCRTLDQMVEAGRRIHEIDPMVCRKWAMDNFSNDRVAEMYEAFFEGKMKPTRTEQRKVAVWCETKWAFGRIGKAIKKYIPNVDLYDWSNGNHNGVLWSSGKWKEYDSIVSNTSLHSLKNLYGFEPDEEMLKRFVVIAHFPRFDEMSYFKETLDGHKKESRYGGVSRETCQEMKKYGVENATYVPFGADTDVFPWTHRVTGPIKRLGIIGGTKRTREWGAHEEYVKNKGLDMFADICQRGGLEPVYIHGREVHDMYNDIDALICCSELEGGPLGIFEAASCGLPVLTRQVGNVQYIKGIAMFETVDEALRQLDIWNGNVDGLREYATAVTKEVRINWSMRTLITKHLAPVLNQVTTYDTMKPEIDKHVTKIKEIVEASGEACEGNVFWFQYNHNETEVFLNKRLNLFNYSQKAHSIMEIGFNAGHSSLLYLLSNPTSKIQLFDLGEHRYTRACFEYLSTQFPNRLTIEFGDSRQTVPAYIAKNVGKVFDMIHVDGGHDQSVVRSDILNTLNLSDNRTVIISDDDNIHHIARVNRQYFEALPDALPSDYHYVGKIR
jgi:glycosyltransferase involved in cell wall biosynthesis